MRIWILVFLLALTFSTDAFAKKIRLLKAPKESSYGAAKLVQEGIQAYKMEFYSGAITAFQKALAEEPAMAEAYFDMAHSYHKLGEHKKAADAFIQAMRFGKDNPKISRSKTLKKHVKDSWIPPR